VGGNDSSAIQDLGPGGGLGLVFFLFLFEWPTSFLYKGRGLVCDDREFFYKLGPFLG
jgi:hypothetical protein